MRISVTLAELLGLQGTTLKAGVDGGRTLSLLTHALEWGRPSLLSRGGLLRGCGNHSRLLASGSVSNFADGLFLCGSGLGGRLLGARALLGVGDGGDLLGLGLLWRSLVKCV